jgi:excisionase family DNA binding protein
MKARLTPREIAERLNIGTRAVYDMLEEGILPSIRVGHRWLITRHAYQQWERNCGLQRVPEVPVTTGLNGNTEVTVN